MADDNNKKNNSFAWLEKLTSTFRSGIKIKHKIPASIAGKTASDVVGHLSSKNYFYMHPNQIYGSFDRMLRYSDYAEMQYTPEINSALNIYAEEITSADENGNVLKVISNNSRIKGIVESLFADIINIDYNLYSWSRNLCKYGDFFLYVDIHPSHGIQSVYPIPVDQIEREEGFDVNDPLAVRFNWITNGNQQLENFQVVHFRLLGDDYFLPYGMSVLEGARRVWRQLTLLEDAVMVYRLVRSPERRVFKIDVGNIPPEHVDAFIEKVRSKMKRQIVVNEKTGRVDLRYSALTVEDDYFIPVRGDRGSDISTLAGGTYTGDIQDIEYLQNKLFTALQIPKAYLGYEETGNAQNALSQIDIRFNKMIQRIQRVIESELKKLAMIHLFCFGYEGEDLLDFDIKLASASVLAIQQKQEIWRTRLELMNSLPETVSKRWAMKTIMGFDDDELEEIFNDKIEEARQELMIQNIAAGEAGGGAEGLGGGLGGGGGGFDFGGGGMDDGGLDLGDLEVGGEGGADAEEPAGGEETGGAGGPESAVEDLFAGDDNDFRGQIGPFGSDGSVLDKDKEDKAEFERRKKQLDLKNAITMAAMGSLDGSETNDPLAPIQRTGHSGRQNAPGQGRRRSPGNSARISGPSSTGKRHVSRWTGNKSPVINRRYSNDLISDNSFKRKVRKKISNKEFESLINNLSDFANKKRRIHEDVKEGKVDSRDIVNNTEENSSDNNGENN